MKKYMMAWYYAAMCGLLVLTAVWGIAQQPHRAKQTALQVVRVIDDPTTDMRWLLTLATEHPGGPGALRINGSKTVLSEVDGPVRALPPIVIRAGERLLVADTNARVSAHLEAVALEPARTGSEFMVRLLANKRCVRAIADGPGHATLASTVFTKGQKP